MKKLALLLIACVIIIGIVQTIGADETLVSELVTLFRGLTHGQIDNAVTQAKNQLATKAKTAEPGQTLGVNELEELFDKQIATLKNLGVLDQIVNTLSIYKNAVVEKASKMAIRNGNIPFLPVIPQSYCSIYYLMDMVRNKGKAGFAYSSTRLFDVFATSKEPYFIYNIEDGKSTLGESPKDAEKILGLQKLSPLTAVEVVALAIHTDVLSRHNVWAAGSRAESNMELNLVPSIWILNGRPNLIPLRACGNEGWGLASCASRFYVQGR